MKLNSESGTVTQEALAHIGTGATTSEIGEAMTETIRTYPNIEWWSHGLSVPRWSAREAVTVEELGFTGYTFNDSQCLGADPYVSMMSAAHVTSHLELATSVTNPVTRHATVTAAAAASLQGETKGRVTLGIGRGDSSLAHLGLAPASVSLLEKYVRAVQQLLAGRSLHFSDLAFASEHLPDVSTLGLKDTPEETRLEWLRPETPKVPVTVTATGPKVIELAARYADGVNFAVGADTERLQWAISVAQEATSRRAPDLNSALSLGCYVSVIVHEDLDEAREMVAGEVASFARFSAMHGQPIGPSNENDADTLRRLHDAYDMRHHFQMGSPQSKALNPDFIDRFAVVGNPEQCAQRLAAIAQTGVTRFLVSTTPGGADRSVTARFRERFAKEVIPLVDSLLNV